MIVWHVNANDFHRSLLNANVFDGVDDDVDDILLRLVQCYLDSLTVD